MYGAHFNITVQSPAIQHKKMKKYFIAIVLLVLLASGIYALVLKRTPLVSEKDYTIGFSTTSPAPDLVRIDREIDFWKKRLDRTPDDIPAQSKIAGLLNSRYAFSGKVDELIEAAARYTAVNQLQSHFGSGTYRALAANCITRHRFKQAQLFLDSAAAMGDDLRLTRLQQFDVSLELGDVAMARSLLSNLAVTKDADYLFREAKFKDHAEGRLDEAILAMEKALSKIDSGAHRELYCWAMANLGDMYSHAGAYKKAYQNYIAVLNKNQRYYHALKGIAWLAFSHDGNVPAAKKILLSLRQAHPVPDYDLMLAEIARFEKDDKTEKWHIRQFMNEVQQPAYGDMYNKYLFYLQADDLKNYDAAWQLANIEVNNRPTPESYNFMSWALYKKGELQQALSIAQKYVEGKCFEPDVIYHLGVLYAAVGNTAKAKQYLTEAYNSRYELGPVCAEEIQLQLKQL
jgi:tetratricopeptide (TPR) repeat protein